MKVKCACGCGRKFIRKDKYGRPRRFVSGHNGRKYDDPTQYKREWNHRNRPARFKYKTERLRKLKVTLLLEKGGKCFKCKVKYNGKNAAIFDFHHKNPSTKEFNLSQGFLGNVSLKRIRKELKKCILVCSNCHRLIHSRRF